MKAPLTDKFSFDQVVVDPYANAITLNGVEKRLEPKLISLLCLLAAQGRDVISRQDITQAIWPNVVVGEESITRAIFALRNALGDDAKQPQYIETIPKKGYRFLVDAQLINESSVVIEPTIRQEALSNGRHFIGYFLAAVALVIGLLLFWYKDETPGAEIASILPLNKMEGVERAISLNSDGTKLLFIHENNQKNDLYSRDLKAAKDILWVRDEFVKKSPVWIDANTIAYIRQHGGEMQVVRNYRDQAPQVLYASSKPILQLSMVNGNSEDLFFLEFQNNELIELRSLNLRNGKQQSWRDIIPELPNKISQLQYSTKSNTLLAVKIEHESPTIVSLDLNTKKVTTISSQFSEVNRIAAINDHSVLVVGSLGAAEGIWFVGEQHSPKLVLRRSGSEAIVDAQIDVKRNIVFYVNLQKNIDVKIVSVRKQEVQSLPELNSSGMDVSATFVKNNKFIYFMSNRTGYYDIWGYDMESKSVKQISTLNALSMTWYSLSHDGKKLAIGFRTDNLYLGVVDVETGKLQSHVKTPSHRHPLAWSFDDKSIYASEHQAEINLFNYDANTLKPSLFAEKSGLYVKSFNEKTLIYVDYKRHALVERNLITQQEKILHDTIPELASLSPGKIKLTKANDGFYTSCQIEWVNKTCLYSLSSTNSSPIVVSDTPFWGLFDITEDGETILAEDIKPSSGDIMKMQLRD
ncbi:MAG TPA: winged helix-turn-helix domain-containing protein [Cellvibrio sp.]|nr:winged helix-turn-helix domain-containing protein [Cellvibrio sp.]